MAMATLKLIEESDRWIIPMQGLTVTQCQIDFAFGLVFWQNEDDGSSSISVRIEEDFVLKVNGQEFKLVPSGQSPTALCPALAAFNKTIESAIAYKDGSLELNFAGGIQIFVPVHHTYEAWTLSASGGLNLISKPSGGVAVWTPS